MHIRNIISIIALAYFTAALCALRCSDLGHIQLAGDQRQKIFEYFPAGKMPAS